MYKLLIADDDEIIRTGIVNIFDWESIKITEIRAVDRAELVQEALEEFKADIVILDIMMQEMSGLDALSLIRENDPEIRVIIFSGFDDFKYAQTALKNGAYDYVLKNAGVNDLFQSVKKLVRELERQKELEQAAQRQQKLLHISIPLLRYRYLNELVFGYQRQDRMLERLRMVDVVLDKDGTFLMAVVEFTEKESLTKELTEEEWVCRKFSAVNVLEELLPESIVFESKQDEILCLLQSFPQKVLDDRKKLAVALKQFQSIVKNIFHTTADIGVGNSGSGMDAIAGCYYSARKMLELRDYLGPGMLIDSQEAVSLGFVTEVDFSEMSKSILQSVMDGNLDKVNGLLEEMFNGQDDSVARYLCIKLVDLLLDFAMENDFNIDVACNYQLKDCAEIIKWKNECEILNWLKELYKHGMECLSENRGNKLNRLMLQAKEFIQENYMKPICLTDIARHVHLAPNYFSTLFSKQFQKSVIEYICTLRMERAKELLQESEVKVFKVGEYAGYENPQYFSRVFKKYMGMSPSEYRRLSQIDTSQKD